MAKKTATEKTEPAMRIIAGDELAAYWDKKLETKHQTKAATPTEMQALRRKTATELAADWQDAHDQCLLYESSAEEYEQQAAQARAALDEERKRRDAVAEALRRLMGG